MPLAMKILYIPLIILCLSAVWFYWYAVYASLDLFSKPATIDPDFHPPLSILKPIQGLEADEYEALASFCRLDYPEYQIIFAARDHDDPALAVVKRIMEEFPHLDTELVISTDSIGANQKVNNLANTLPFVKHSLLLISDSDIHVNPDYLRHIVQPFKSSSVGVVTCMYRSPATGPVAELEGMGISTDFHAGAMAARKLEGMTFAFGSTILMRKETLEAIGGFASVADYIADDFLLGNLSAAAGYEVVLSDYIVDHPIPSQKLSEMLRHQTRWNRSIRASRPWGYTGLIFTHGTAASLLLLLISGGSIFGWAALVVVWASRLAMGWVAGVHCLKDPTAKKRLWLIPARDLITFLLWCYSFIGKTIEWRGRKYILKKGGKMVPLE